MKLLLTTLLIFSFLISCVDEKKTYNDETVALSSIKKLKITNSTRKIFILTENECLTCNRDFANLMERNLNDSSSVFIINASGLKVDISMFEAPKNNIIHKKTNEPFFQKTKAIVLSNKKIDTILEINLKEKLSQFIYLNSLR
jgi:hypothetical protein